MTGFLISGNGARVGRKKQWAQDMQARFAEGTFEHADSRGNGGIRHPLFGIDVAAVRRGLGMQSG